MGDIKLYLATLFLTAATGAGAGVLVDGGRDLYKGATEEFRDPTIATDYREGVSGTFSDIQIPWNESAIPYGAGLGTVVGLILASRLRRSMNSEPSQ